jgi:hypothetical protein
VGVLLELARTRGFLRLICRSTQFSIITTESVLGSRLSAEVRIVCDGVTLNVTAIPLSACRKFSNYIQLKFKF